MKFFVNREGRQLGPWAFEDILKKIRASELDWTDYIYDERAKDWVLMMNYGPMSDHFKVWTAQIQRSNPVLSKSVPQNIDEEWFILKGENKYGPFAYLDLVKMLQKKEIFEYDYVWNKNKMLDWQRVADLADFQSEKIKALKASGSARVSDVFFRRRHARAKYGASILLHNNREVWKGHSIEVSSSGAGIVIEASHLEIGQSVFMHFQAGDGVPPFNAVCAIVSKQVLKGKQVRYGVKFTTISQSVQRAIKKYTDHAA